MDVHIVVKGDTLWKIARQYGIPFDELKRVNAHLANPDYIVPGMKIFLPPRGSHGGKHHEQHHSGQHHSEQHQSGQHHHGQHHQEQHHHGQHHHEQHHHEKHHHEKHHHEKHHHEKHHEKKEHMKHPEKMKAPVKHIPIPIPIPIPKAAPQIINEVKVGAPVTEIKVGAPVTEVEVTASPKVEVEVNVPPTPPPPPAPVMLPEMEMPMEMPMPMHYEPMHYEPMHHEPMHHVPMHHVPMHHVPMHHVPMHHMPMHIPMPMPMPVPCPQFVQPIFMPCHCMPIFDVDCYPFMHTGQIQAMPMLPVMEESPFMEFESSMMPVTLPTAEIPMYEEEFIESTSILMPMVESSMVEGHMLVESPEFMPEEVYETAEYEMGEHCPPEYGYMPEMVSPAYETEMSQFYPSYTQGCSCCGGCSGFCGCGCQAQQPMMMPVYNPWCFPVPYQMSPFSHVGTNWYGY